MAITSENQIKFAALADYIYRRADNDQSIKLGDIDNTYVAVELTGGVAPDGLVFSSENTGGVNYFYSERGFGAQVISDQAGNFIVVFRGTDSADIATLQKGDQHQSLWPRPF